MRDVRDCSLIKEKKSETLDATQMKRSLCRIGRKLGFIVDVEEIPESELGSLSMRYDVLWYSTPPTWYTDLLELTSSRKDLEPEYRELIEARLRLDRLLYVAFEIEATDQTTKGMKGDISNLSKLPYGMIVVRRGRTENSDEQEAIRKRFEKALMEFRKLHGPNTVVITSFEDIKALEKKLFSSETGD